MKNVTLHFPRRCHTDNRRYHNTRSSGGSCTVDLRASRIAGVVHPSLPCQVFIPLINKLLTVRNRILPQKRILPHLISILCNMKFHHHVRNSLWISPILRQRDPNRNLPPYPFKNVFSIILPPTPRLSKWPTLFRCCHQNPVCISHSRACHTPSPFKCLWFDNYNDNQSDLQFFKLHSVQPTPSSPAFLSPTSVTPSAPCSLNMPMPILFAQCDKPHLTLVANPRLH